MSPEREPRGHVEITQDDRIRLSNDVLEVIQTHFGIGTVQEIEIGFQRILQESEIEGLTDADALDVPYETFKNIGAMLQELLRDYGDQRTVKVRADRIFHILYDPTTPEKAAMGMPKHIRNLLPGMRPPR